MGRRSTFGGGAADGGEGVGLALGQAGHAAHEGEQVAALGLEQGLEGGAVVVVGAEADEAGVVPARAVGGAAVAGGVVEGGGLDAGVEGGEEGGLFGGAAGVVERGVSVDAVEVPVEGLLEGAPAGGVLLLVGLLLSAGRRRR